MHFLRQGLKMNQQPLLFNLQTLFKAVCTPTGVLGMLWVGTAMPWSCIHVNENSNQTFGKPEWMSEEIATARMDICQLKSFFFSVFS